jgi:hypothetical protein
MPDLVELPTYMDRIIGLSNTDGERNVCIGATRVHRPVSCIIYLPFVLVQSKRQGLFAVFEPTGPNIHFFRDDSSWLDDMFTVNVNLGSKLSDWNFDTAC